jgi:hypothetical protein
MSSTEPGVLWKKSAKQAAMTSGNIVSGAISLAASAALWNPLPLILWGLGSTSWILFASTSEKRLRKILDEDKEEDEKVAEGQRDAQRRAVEALLDVAPFQDWIRRGLLPDYLDQYQRLVGVRDTIGRLARDRPEIEVVTEMGIKRQLNYMLSAFLQFVRARISFLQILAAVDQQRADPSPPPQPSRSDLRGKATPHGQLPQRGEVWTPTPPEIPDSGSLLKMLEEKIARLKDLAQKEPASAKAREWHIGILQKQKDLLKDCGQRDQAVAAQLEAFPDAFNVVLGRVSAAQFDPNEVSNTMDTIVERVEETERFVRAFAPAMDQVLSGLQAEPQSA